MRTGLYPENSAAQGQVLRLSRVIAPRASVWMSTCIPAAGASSRQ